MHIRCIKPRARSYLHLTAFSFHQILDSSLVSISSRLNHATLCLFEVKLDFIESILAIQTESQLFQGALTARIPRPNAFSVAVQVLPWKSLRENQFALAHVHAHKKHYC